MIKTDREKMAHILRRFGLGSSEADVRYYLQTGGLAGAIDRLLDFENEPELVEISLEEFRDPKATNYNTRDVQLWWLAKMLTTRRPVLEKLTLFWHHHFATSDAKVNAAYLMYQQNGTLRAAAGGRFENLLLALCRDPAMIIWLDNRFNVKGRPNENFGREIMELFSLGFGNYNEADVRDAARAFTGWNLRRTNPKDDGGKGAGEFVFQPRQHDDGMKGVLAKFGAWDGGDVVRILCEHPQCPLFIAKKFWEFFAYPAPEKAVVERMARAYRDSQLDTRALVRAMLSSEEFYADKAVGGLVKSPVDVVIAPLRQLGVGDELVLAIQRNGGKLDRTKMLGPLQAAREAMKAMGMDLLFPPDVSGWDGGLSWISSSTMLERIRWADGLFGQSKSRRPQARLTAAPLLTADRSAEGVARRFTSLLDAHLPASKQADLARAAQSGMGPRLTNQTANVAAAAVCRLIFSAPEFQFS